MVQTPSHLTGDGSGQSNTTIWVVDTEANVAYGTGLCRCGSMALAQQIATMLNGV